MLRRPTDLFCLTLILKLVICFIVLLFLVEYYNIVGTNKNYYYSVYNYISSVKLKRNDNAHVPKV